MTTDKRNAALVPEWSSMTGDKAAKAMLEIAEQLDARTATLPAEMVQLIVGGENAWMLEA